MTVNSATRAEQFGVHDSYDKDRLFPIFIPSSGRATTAQLNLEAGHALGQQDIPSFLFLVVVEHELQDYRIAWPQSLILSLP